jgi:hypothetical protein
MIRKLPKIFILFIFCTFALNVSAQDGLQKCLTIGVLQGGGGLVGADIEIMPIKHIGLQVGFGAGSAGAALNFHLKPNLESPFLSFILWNQGFGDQHLQRVAGVNLGYRGKEWFHVQAGAGLPLTYGPGFEEDHIQPPVIFMFSIGAYFSFYKLKFNK